MTDISSNFLWDNINPTCTNYVIRFMLSLARTHARAHRHTLYIVKFNWSWDLFYGSHEITSKENTLYRKWSSERTLKRTVVGKSGDFVENLQSQNQHVCSQYPQNCFHGRWSRVTSTLKNLSTVYFPRPNWQIDKIPQKHGNPVYHTNSPLLSGHRNTSFTTFATRPCTPLCALSRPTFGRLRVDMMIWFNPNDGLDLD